MVVHLLFGGIPSELPIWFHGGAAWIGCDAFPVLVWLVYVSLYVASVCARVVVVITLLDWWQACSRTDPGLFPPDELRSNLTGVLNLEVSVFPPIRPRRLTIVWGRSPSYFGPSKCSLASI